MKTILKSVIAIIILSSALLSSCGKYEEGPAISFASKKSRLCGKWKVEKYMVNDVDQTAAIQAIIGSDFVWEIEKDGKYKQISGGSTADEGTWELGEDKDDIRFLSNQSGSQQESYRILRLKSKELWWKQTQPNGDVEEVHFDSAD